MEILNVYKVEQDSLRKFQIALAPTLFRTDEGELGRAFAQIQEELGRSTLSFTHWKTNCMTDLTVELRSPQALSESRIEGVANVLNWSRTNGNEESS